MSEEQATYGNRSPLTKAISAIADEKISIGFFSDFQTALIKTPPVQNYRAGITRFSLPKSLGKFYTKLPGRYIHQTTDTKVFRETRSVDSVGAHRVNIDTPTREKKTLQLPYSPEKQDLPLPWTKTSDTGIDIAEGISNDKLIGPGYIHRRCNHS